LGALRRLNELGVISKPDTISSVSGGASPPRRSPRPSPRARHSTGTAASSHPSERLPHATGARRRCSRACSRGTGSGATPACACFPPIVNPRKLRLDPGRFTGGRFPAGRRRDRLVRGMRLTDGGDYDNLGLEPVWKTHQVVLVSDGGAPFDVSEDRGLLWRVGRYSAIAQNQAPPGRVRGLVDSFKD